ncbi:alpha/beta hydrolase domain-containing protein [Spirosoma sp.]|uniref:alpha/beta hydrolase domain-containing protein n=1 Tax=Spirosoma sp. TaxID=1899569 RepID=UPI003B3B1DA5
MPFRYCLLVFLSVGLFLPDFPAQANIVKLVITKTESYAGGRAFGKAGTYERVYGQAYGEVDPNLASNKIIQDLRLAPRNNRGLVEYVSEFILLRPTDMAKSNGLLFLSLPNRGNVFPADTTLLKRGYVYLWSAWQGDVLAGNSRLTIKVPVATENGREITGKVRAEFQVFTPAQTQLLSSGPFSGATHHSYETVSLDNTGLQLTKRVHEADPHVLIPNSDWAFSDCTTKPFPGTPSISQLSIKGGFDPNYIYELVYTAKNPLVMGLGFAAIRDITSFLRNSTTDEASNRNPLLSAAIQTIPIRAAILQGVSQCSNFCRTFLQLGFNQDESGKRVFDGINAHIATRRNSLNVRFGRPGGGGLQREDHLFPSNEAPFTWQITNDSVSGITGGILEACSPVGNCPKIMQTLSSSEYRQIRASLPTTDPAGTKDLTIPDNVRIYFIAGTQHSPNGAQDPLSGFQMNYNPTQPTLRALLIALEQWVLSDKLPPASAYPTLKAKTLVLPDAKSIGWPSIPGVVYNGLFNNVPLLDFGADFDSHYITGIVTNEPPKVVRENAYAVLVPKVNQDGNEIAGIRNTTMQVPLGTYTGWALRRAGYGAGDLASLNGMFIPFKKTKAERLATGDPRLSLEERYGTHEAYVVAVRKAADDLVKEGFLLPEDAQNEVSIAEKSNVLK